MKPGESVTRENIPALIERIKVDTRFRMGRYDEGGIIWSLRMTPEVADAFLSGYFVTADGRKVRITSIWVNWISDNIANITPQMQTFDE
jgi:hypothetical protein